MSFVECLEVSQEDRMEGPLWWETLGTSLGSQDAAGLVGGTCHGNGWRQETTRHHAISRESKVQFFAEDTYLALPTESYR